MILSRKKYIYIIINIYFSNIKNIKNIIIIIKNIFINLFNKL